MMYNELVRNSGAEAPDAIQCLYGLREKKWAEFDLAEGAETGLVWLTPAGIRVAGDICQSAESGAEGMGKADDGVRHESVPEKETAEKSQSPDKRTLREAMTKSFTMEDLEVLCADIEQELHDNDADLEVSLEMVGGNGKKSRILKLIDYLDRRDI